MEHGSGDAVQASRVPLTAERVAALVGGRAALTALAVTSASTSTNSELLVALESDPDAWPHLSAFVADHQTAGRGRAGRTWTTPAGAALTVSFVLRPNLEPEQWGLVPLAVGLAVVRALRSDDVEAWLKWPNDVVVRTDGAEVPGWGKWRKVAGILCERRADAVVSGVGVNVSQDAAELPVQHASSLAMLGARTLDRLALLDALSEQVAHAVSELEADAGAMLEELSAVTATLGGAVVVERPGEPPLTGKAESLAADGALVVRTADGTAVAVFAGDVRLRRAD